MKKSKILVPAVALLGLSIAGATTGTVAWFSANTTVTATGMTIYSTTPSSLVISKTHPVGTLTAIDFSAQSGDAADGQAKVDASELAPATHQTAAMSPIGADNQPSTSSTGLVYVTNGDDVDPHTGFAKVDTDEDGTTTTRTLNYAEANNSGNKFYVDYECYLASAGEPIGGAGYTKKLHVTLKADADSYDYTVKAASIDFYCYKVGDTNDGEFSLNNYKGTLNVAQVKPDNTGAEWKDLVLFTPTEDEQIPANNDNASSGIHILMRVYFDGNLTNTANTNQKYVLTDHINTDHVTLTTTFRLAD